MVSRKAIIGSVAGVIVVLGVYGLNRERVKVGGLRNLVSLTYWRAVFNHTNLYAPGARTLKHGNPDLHEVAITIDDAPRPSSCGQILDVLKREGVHATFFAIGVRVKARPDLVRRMVDEGNEVGNHTQDHLRLITLRPDQVEKEITFMDANFYKATGRHLDLLRPPGMDFNDSVLKIVKQLGYVMVNWTAAAKDFISPTHPHAVPPEEIADRIVSEIDNGGIILIHDAPLTAQALPLIIDRLKAKGYKFVTITEMLAHLPQPVIIKTVAGPYTAGELAKLEKADPVPTPAKFEKPSKPATNAAKAGKATSGGGGDYSVE